MSKFKPAPEQLNEFRLVIDQTRRNTVSIYRQYAGCIQALTYDHSKTKEIARSPTEMLAWICPPIMWRAVANKEHPATTTNGNGAIGSVRC